MTKLYFVTGIALLALNACGPTPRPTGLPPPEYEEPRVEPWAPPAAAAAPSAAAPEPEPAAPAPAPAATPENLGGSGATLPPGTP
jgi:hypothetical protein